MPLIAITMGDPCGVGPEIIVKALDLPGFPCECYPLVIGDRLPIERAIQLLGSSAVVRPITRQMLPSLRSGTLAISAGMIPLLEPAAEAGDHVLLHSFGPGFPRSDTLYPGCVSLTPSDIEFCKPSPAACVAVISWIGTAVRLALAGSIDAVCTCPINKEQLHRQGFPFPGHTEFIRKLTQAEDVVMMLAGPRLKVALATIHESLADVPGLLTKDLLRKVVRITAEAMFHDFGVKSPRIAVAGLNPHAGEAGKFGRDEIEVIKPVIEEFDAAHLSDRISMGTNWTSETGSDHPHFPGMRGFCARISGPWPADTIFRRALTGEFDAVIAMYHDQGLIPIKLIHFGEAVNVSLGLRVVRTSVDHGTAYDIAGKGVADPGSLIEALRLAASIALNRGHAQKSKYGR